MGAGNLAGSYYAGASITSQGNTARGGLVGQRTGSATIAADSYWNKDPGGVPDTSAGSQNTAGKTTAELQTPTGYTGIYATWNSNLDGQTGNDDPWDFGASNDYPVLKYGGHKPTDQGRTLKDYDDNGNGLIDLRTLAQLDAIRYDLDGNGAVSATNRNQYRAAFPNATAGMGCPLTDHDGDSDTAQEPTCTGYELRNSLDFDQNNDDTITAADGDAGYWNGGAGWVPLGSATAGYGGVFEGNNNAIANLFINIPTGSSSALTRIGLFARLNSGGVIRGVGLANANVSRAYTTDFGIGALVGENFGTVTASYATGAVSGTDTGTLGSRVGGLVGQNASGSVIQASWANVTVAMNSRGGWAGGLVGYSYGARISASYARVSVNVTNSHDAHVGGLVGEIADNTTPDPDVPATIDTSYARVAVSETGTGTRTLGALVARSTATARVTNSYYDSTATSSPLGSAGAAGKTTAELQNPVCYTGDYAGWNVDLDGDGAADQPWYFGGGSDYPVLQYGGHSLAAQGIASRLAELTGLEIAPGQVYGDFLHCPMEYRAVASPAVTEITVSPTAADGVTVTPTYQDGNDNALADSNAGTDGQQTPWPPGRTRSRSRSPPAGAMC